jgi:hypothetical protein
MGPGLIARYISDLIHFLPIAIFTIIIATLDTENPCDLFDGEKFEGHEGQ